MAERKALTAHELQQANVAFLHFDADCSGSIDVAELKLSMAALGHHVEEAEVLVMLHKIDKDKSGSIEWEEFLQLLEEQKAAEVARGEDADAIEAFVAMGGKPDKSGSVEIARLKKVITFFELNLDVDGFIKCADLDEDGSISYSEFVQLITPPPI